MSLCYLTRFMVHATSGEVRNTTAVIAFDITAFFYAAVLTPTAEGEMRTRTFTLSPLASARSFLGLWEGESSLLLLPNLQLWLENKVRLCSRMNTCASL